MLKFEVALSLTLESETIVNTEYTTLDRRQIPPGDPPRLPAGERRGPVRRVVGARHRVGKTYSGDKFRFRKENQRLPPIFLKNPVFADNTRAGSEVSAEAQGDPRQGTSANICTGRHFEDFPPRF